MGLLHMYLFVLHARELLNVNMQLLERAENLENENKMLKEKLGMESCGSEVVTNQKQNLQRIKTEFDEALQSVEAEIEQPDIQIRIPESILSPDESSGTYFMCSSLFS